jgi:hypothetical protein
MRQPALLAAVAGLGVWNGVAYAAPDPLAENLRTLERRIPAIREPEPAPKKAPRARSGGTGRRSSAARRRRRAGDVAAAAYSSGRIGSNPSAGDLRVEAQGGRVVHVYVRQCLVSDLGNGRAVVPDLQPGRYPVMLWDPEACRRRTYWVQVRPGAVSSLRAGL